MNKLMAAVLIAVPIAIQAGELPVHSLETGVIYLSPDDAGSDVGGYIAGRAGLSESVYIFGDYGQASPDYHFFPGGRQDITHAVGTLGFGLRMPVSAASDFAVEGGWIRSSWDFPGTTAEEDGGLAAFHVRSRFDSGLELSTRAGYVVDGPTGSTWIAAMGARFGLAGNFGLTANALTFGGEDIHVRLGLRYDF